MLYFLPEIMILIFLALNEIYLRMIGLFYETEDEIENIIDGLKRNIEQGDEEKILKENIEKSQMNMSDLFKSFEE